MWCRFSGFLVIFIMFICFCQHCIYIPDRCQQPSDASCVSAHFNLMDLEKEVQRSEAFCSWWWDNKEECSSLSYCSFNLFNIETTGHFLRKKCNPGRCSSFEGANTLPKTNMEPENAPLECVVVANLRVSAWLNRPHGIFAPLAAMAEIAMVSCLDLGGSGGSRMGLLNGPLNYDRENGKTKTTLYISQKATPHPKIPKKPVKLMAKFLP